MTGGLVLAAGAGRRFGSPKQLAELDGRPLLQHALDAMLAADGVDDVVLVLGAEAEAVRAAVDPGRARVVVCPDWAEGMAASLRAGVAALDGAERVVVCLGDEPGMTPGAITAALRHARGADGARATYGGIPGHPVVLGAPLLRRIGELHGDTGARELLAGAAVRTFEAEGLARPIDVDTPSDLEKLHS
ncbi:MAG: nucleotidyltransferase family protein [Solirubrobacteraceae bacterium]